MSAQNKIPGKYLGPKWELGKVTQREVSEWTASKWWRSSTSWASEQVPCRVDISADCLEALWRTRGIHFFHRISLTAGAIARIEIFHVLNKQAVEWRKQKLSWAVDIRRLQPRVKFRWVPRRYGFFPRSALWHCSLLQEHPVFRSYQSKQNGFLRIWSREKDRWLDESRVNGQLL